MPLFRRKRKARRAASRNQSSFGGPWRACLDRRDVLILDTETTGLSRQAEVIEIAVMDTLGQERLHSLILPQGQIDHQATHVHGHTRKSLRRMAAPPWPRVHDAWYELLDQAVLLLAYNVAFDRRILQQTCQRYDLAFPATPWRCIMREYAHRNRKVKLEEACRIEGVARPQSHRALDDVQMTLDLMRSVAAQESHG